MVTDEMLRQAVARVVATTRPRKVILFGSYARCDADEGSDLDLLVVDPQASGKYDTMGTKPHVEEARRYEYGRTHDLEAFAQLPEERGAGRLIANFGAG